MNSSHLVTVIIATYNRSNALLYSIRSALNQTYANIEVIVVGDGCTDDSQAVVEDIRDPRLRWIGLTNNSGHQSEPNNVGLEKARGEIIAYLGHDDLWLPHHVQSGVEKLCQGYDLVYSLTLIVRAKNADRFLVPVAPSYEPGKWIPPSGILHQRSVTEDIGGWKHYTQVACDPEIDLWRRAYNANYKFAFVPRLSVIKIPAASRKDIYKTRSSDEQAFWYWRIQDEPDLEANELATCYVNLRSLNSELIGLIAYKNILRNFVQETIVRLGQCLKSLVWRKRPRIEQRRQYKGLKPKP